MYRVVSVALLALGLSACGGSGSEPTPVENEAKTSAEAAVNFEISDAYVRKPLDGQTSTAAYFMISSQSNKNALIVGIYADKAGTAELHSHDMSGGMMAMRKVDQVELPAGESVEFRPLGYHAMLFDVADGLEEGDTVTLTLDVYSDGTTSRVVTEAPIRPLG